MYSIFSLLYYITLVIIYEKLSSITQCHQSLHNEELIIHKIYKDTIVLLFYIIKSMSVMVFSKINVIIILICWRIYHWPFINHHILHVLYLLSEYFLQRFYQMLRRDGQVYRTPVLLDAFKQFTQHIEDRIKISGGEEGDGIKVIPFHLMIFR